MQNFSFKTIISFSTISIEQGPRTVLNMIANKNGQIKVSKKLILFHAKVSLFSLELSIKGLYTLVK